jgi:mannose-6-phosphate isomerase-like protein (cupin superfamily)/rubrerythrin
MSRNQQGNHQDVFEAILAGIKGEASDIDFYSRLVNLAPDQNHKNDILHVLEDEKVHLQQFTNLYIMLTGRQPMYQIEKVPFQTYGEGLQKAYEAELADYEEYQNGYLLTQNSPVRDVFLRASADEKEHAKRFGFLQSSQGSERIKLNDHGPKPYVVNIETATKQNNTYRTALWTGQHLQVTLMSIKVGEDIGLEIHPAVDQFLRIEQGQGIVQMGKRKDQLTFEKKVYDNFAIMVPAGTWHNVTNTGNIPLKLYSIYAPPNHPRGTIHVTKADAMAAE